MTKHEFPSVLSTSTAVPVVPIASPGPVLPGGAGRPPTGGCPPAAHDDGAWFVPDGRVLQVLGVVRASGVAAAGVRFGRGMGRAALEGVLTAMILTAGEGLPMTVSSFTWMLHRGVSPRVRGLLGVRDGVGHALARARVVRLLDKLVPWGDASGRCGPDRASLDSTTGQLLEAAWSAQPGEARDRWTGDVAFEGGFVEPAGRRVEPPAAPAGGDVDAGWLVRASDSAGGGRPRRWGYEVQLAVVVQPSPRRWVPGAVVGLRLHRPGLDRRPLWLGMLADTRALRCREGCPKVGRGPGASRAWTDTGRRGPGPEFVRSARALGYRVPARVIRSEGPSEPVRRARAGAEAALARAGASRQGAGSSLTGLWGTSLVVACELVAWNLGLARRGDPGRR